MSAGCCMRWVLGRTVRSLFDVSCGYRIPASRFMACCQRPNNSAFTWRCSSFSTAVGDSEETPAPKKEKREPQSQETMRPVGRMIPHHLIDVISDTGENLGTMDSAQVIKIMDEKGLKLVLLNKNKDPPIYKLMSGKQIHEEKLKLREKQKAKAATVQVKELTFSSGIGAKDLTTKLKQVESWLERKHHVKITLRASRGAPAVNLETSLEQMLHQMEVMVGFVSLPKATGDGKTAKCILRPPSDKELSKKLKSKAENAPPPELSSKATPSKTVCDTDTTEGSKQQ